MAEVLVASDVVAALIGLLNAKLAPVKAHGEVPNPRPAKFVRVLLVGGAGRVATVTDKATIVVEGWAATNPDAHDLCQLARAHVMSAGATVLGGITIYRVDEIAGPGSLPDPDSDQSRYTMTCEVTSRLTRLV